MPLPPDPRHRSRELARDSEWLDMQTGEQEPSHKYRNPGAAPSGGPSHSNAAAGTLLPEYSSVGLFANFTSSSGLRAGEDIVVPICDVKPTDPRIFIPENSQQPEAESVEFSLNFFGSRKMDSHAAMCCVHQVAFSNPKRAGWHFARNASQRLGNQL